MDQIRILIADDHPLFRDGLRALLESVPDMQVIGEVATGNEVMAQAQALHPDVILMDIKMPGLNGIEAPRRVLQTSPHIRILVITMFEDDESVFAAIRAGARGYLLKGAVQEETLRSEEHTSELQSPDHLVCRLLLEKKKKRAAPSAETDRVAVAVR